MRNSPQHLYDGAASDVRFILVNGRAPRPRAFCVKCDQPIEKSYLREIGTHLIYCDHNCYADHCESAFLLLEKQELYEPSRPRAGSNHR